MGRFKMKFLQLLTAAVLGVGFASQALAQDADGNDTPGNWVVTHYEEFGIWKSMRPNDFINSIFSNFSVGGPFATSNGY